MICVAVGMVVGDGGGGETVVWVTVGDSVGTCMAVGKVVGFRVGIGLGEADWQLVSKTAVNKKINFPMSKILEFIRKNKKDSYLLSFRIKKCC